ncbi:MAG TPA: site-specific integrase, partial [Pseudolabrys sp.]|nr:site-specific integrase [Pseudolabrys sp.]
MARRLRDSTLDSRPARAKLKPRGEPYYRSVEKGVHLGYRRRSGSAGTWLVRRFNGTAYRAVGLGIADDLSDADGVTVLDYWQAIDAVRNRLAEQGRTATASVKRLTVADAMDRYIGRLETEGRSTHSVKDVR